MQYNGTEELAADVYLIHHWASHNGAPEQRRCKIFQEFVELGQRERWKWHQLAERTELTVDEDAIRKCRPGNSDSVAAYIGRDYSRVIMTDRNLDMSQDEIDVRTGSNGLESVCEYESNPFHTLPEIVYSMTRYDDPDDIEEARMLAIQDGAPDQSLWVTGVYWDVDKIVWVDEFGRTIREKIFESISLKEGSEPFERSYGNPFESIWWTTASKVGKYVDDEWWL